MSISEMPVSDSSLIQLEGVVDIASASQIKSTLLEAMKTRREIRISVDKVTDLDVTAVQLLWAAKREAKRLGVSFAFEGKPSEMILEFLSSVGLDDLAIFD
jgi:anti-anti-sigma regulatory factor